MNKLLFRTSSFLLVVFAFCLGGIAQKRDIRPGVADKFVISADAGGVGFTEGSVSVARPGQTTGRLLVKGDRVEIGDRVTTDIDSRAEILLNPGSYLRVSENSEFEFKTTSLDDLQIALSSGSAIFEVYATDDFTVTVFTPKGQAVLVETGIYRVDLGLDGTGIIAVTDGQALVAGVKVKEGRTATIGNGTVTVAKFDRGKRDEMANWSRSRSKDLAKMTSSLSQRDLRTSLASSYRLGMWNMRSSFGLWVFDRFHGRYCFLPFGYGWDSPYGYGYGYGMFAFFRPPVRFYPNPASPTPTATQTGRKERRIIDTPLPYTRLKEDRGIIRGGFDPISRPDAPTPIRRGDAVIAPSIQESSPVRVMPPGKRDKP